MSDESDPVADELRADAWCGEPARGTLHEESSLAWGMRRDLPRVTQLLAPIATDEADWKQPTVGWGVVLPDRVDVPGTDKALGVDAPKAIRTLLSARGQAPVLRYDAALQPGTLRRYDAKGKPSEPSFSGERGMGANAIPRYLLIVGSPTEIPWSVQYRMQNDAFVGRLDLEPDGLERYVESLIRGWDGATLDPCRPVVWAVDRGFPDITHLMRRGIADRLHDGFAEDPDGEFDMGSGFISDGNASHASLRTALAQRKPAFVFTSSHGATFPLNDHVAMRDQLGLPIDLDGTVLDVDTLTRDWNPYGAVWYAHACCSAGSDAKSMFEGLVGGESSLGRTLSSIANVGACSAPLPRHLLGGQTPLRAFIGHVEPTFNWTLQSPTTGEVTTHHVVNALYNQLHGTKRPPVGLAMRVYFQAVAGLLQDYWAAIDDVDKHLARARQAARRAKLVAYDRLAMVLLGDPTVSLPRSGPVSQRSHKIGGHALT